MTTILLHLLRILNQYTRDYTFLIFNIQLCAPIELFHAAFTAKRFKLTFQTFSENLSNFTVKLIPQQVADSEMSSPVLTRINIQLLPETFRYFLIWLAACEHIFSLAITWTSSYLTYEKPERDATPRLAGMPRHAHTLSCLLLGFCSLPKLCFHGNIRITPCWNSLDIVNSCMNQSDIADALIALISEKAFLVFHLSFIYSFCLILLFFRFIIMETLLFSL